MRATQFANALTLHKTVDYLQTNPLNLCRCCSRRLPKLSFGKLPTLVDYKLVCSSALTEGLRTAGGLEEAVPTI
jgi:hypothetical protein